MDSLWITVGTECHKAHLLKIPYHLMWRFIFKSRCSEHELVAKKIRQFLQLDDSTLASPGSEGSNGEDIDHCSTTSDESFEQIDKSELVDEEEDMEEKVDRGKEDAAEED